MVEIEYNSLVFLECEARGAGTLQIAGEVQVTKGQLVRDEKGLRNDSGDRDGEKHREVSPEDPGAQFLIRTGSVGRNRAEASLERAQNLNPMVDVKVDTENIEKKPESFFTQFDAVCLTCCSRDIIVKVDQICHKNSIKFFTGDVFGYHGYTFANLGEHEFVEEKTKVAKVSQGVEDGPDTKRAKLDSSETTMVKKIWKPLLGATLASYEENVGSPGRHSAAFAYHS
ncbi:SUMO-activating enzyme subunit 1, partial [Eschrichtius robustus]|nr:SUMO-activating enzyme subunit 1 [Eschrichtius robustus]